MSVLDAAIGVGNVFPPLAATPHFPGADEQHLYSNSAGASHQPHHRHLDAAAHSSVLTADLLYSPRAGTHDDGYNISMNTNNNNTKTDADNTCIGFTDCDRAVAVAPRPYSTSTSTPSPFHRLIAHYSLVLEGAYITLQRNECSEMWYQIMRGVLGLGQAAEGGGREGERALADANRQRAASAVARVAAERRLLSPKRETSRPRQHHGRTNEVRQTNRGRSPFSASFGSLLRTADGVKGEVKDEAEDLSASTFSHERPSSSPPLSFVALKKNPYSHVVSSGYSAASYSPSTVIAAHPRRPESSSSPCVSVLASRTQSPRAELTPTRTRAQQPLALSQEARHQYQRQQQQQQQQQRGGTISPPTTRPPPTQQQHRQQVEQRQPPQGPSKNRVVLSLSPPRPKSEDSTMGGQRRADNASCADMVSSSSGRAAAGIGGLDGAGVISVATRPPSPTHSARHDASSSPLRDSSPFEKGNGLREKIRSRSTSPPSRSRWQAAYAADSIDKANRGDIHDKSSSNNTNTAATNNAAVAAVTSSLSLQERLRDALRRCDTLERAIRAQRGHMRVVMDEREEVTRLWRHVTEENKRLKEELVSGILAALDGDGPHVKEGREGGSDGSMHLLQSESAKVEKGTFAATTMMTTHPSTRRDGDVGMASVPSATLESSPESPIRSTSPPVSWQQGGTAASAVGLMPTPQHCRRSESVSTTHIVDGSNRGGTARDGSETDIISRIASVTDQFTPIDYHSSRAAVGAMASRGDGGEGPLLHPNSILGRKSVGEGKGDGGRASARTPTHQRGGGDGQKGTAGKASSSAAGHLIMAAFRARGEGGSTATMSTSTPPTSRSVSAAVGPHHQHHRTQRASGVAAGVKGKPDHRATTNTTSNASSGSVGYYTPSLFNTAAVEMDRNESVSAIANGTHVVFTGGPTPFLTTRKEMKAVRDHKQREKGQQQQMTAGTASDVGDSAASSSVWVVPSIEPVHGNGHDRSLSTSKTTSQTVAAAVQGGAASIKSSVRGGGGGGRGSWETL